MNNPVLKSLTNYITSFLVKEPLSNEDLVFYGYPYDAPNIAKIIIVPAIPDYNISNLPQHPFQYIDKIPILYGTSKIENIESRYIIHADIILSSFFLLSRYEEILKPNCRDKYGRFLSKDSIVFQQGYGSIPLVDEYGLLLRNWLRELRVMNTTEKNNFNKIYLTHDIDNPFRFLNLLSVFKQYIKNAIKYNTSPSPLKKYLDPPIDDYFTFPDIIAQDKKLLTILPSESIDVIYFLICSYQFLNNKYYNINSKKINYLINYLQNSDVKFGIHLSVEAGENPHKTSDEVSVFTKRIKLNYLYSRHHFLDWREPEDIKYLENSGITDDFTLGYADSTGFRVGTCKPYRFINPETKELSNIIVHPLEIMDCSLSNTEYMNLDYEQAFSNCKEIINQVKKHNGELVLLWHNTEFTGINYHKNLYNSIIEYLKTLI